MPASKWASDALYNYLVLRTPEFVNARVGSRPGQKNARTMAVLNAILLDVKSMFKNEVEGMNLPTLGHGGTPSERDIALKMRIRQLYFNLLRGTTSGTGKRQLISLSSKTRRNLARHHAYSKLYWDTKLKKIIESDYSKIEKSLPEGAKPPAKAAFRNKRLKELLETEAADIHKEVDEFIVEHKKQAVAELEWADAEEVGEEEVARRNKLCDRQVKIAALARTIEEAQACLAKETGCVSFTFWGVPIPIKGGTVCAYSLGTGETKEGGKRFEDFVGHEGWMSFTKAFSRWAGECFSEAERLEADLAPEAFKSARPDQDLDNWWENDDVAGDTATDHPSNETSTRTSTGGQDQCTETSKDTRATKETTKSANVTRTSFNPDFYLHSEGDPDVLGEVYHEISSGGKTVRYRLPYPHLLDVETREENGAFVNECIMKNTRVKTSALMRATGLTPREGAALVLAEIQARNQEAARISDSAFQRRPAFIEKPSTFSPMAAPSDTNADGSISQAANDIPMPDISTSPLNETVQHNEDETLFHMSDLTSVPSLSRDPTPAPPCVDLEVPTKYRWMKIALSHITSLMKENHGTEISYLWASIEKGLGYPSGAGDPFELDISSLPRVIQDWFIQFTTFSNVFPSLKTNDIDTNLIHITKQWWTSLHPTETAMCVDEPDSRDRWQSMLKGGHKGLIRFLALLALCPSVAVSPDLRLDLVNLVDDVITDLKAMLSTLEDNSDVESSATKTKAGDEGVGNGDAEVQSPQNKRSSLAAPAAQLPANDQPKRKRGRPKKDSKENSVQPATLEPEKTPRTTRASARAAATAQRGRRRQK